MDTNILNEIQKTRTSLIHQINVEFDKLIMRVKEGIEEDSHLQIQTSGFEKEIPLMIGAGYFKGEKPIQVKFPAGSTANTPNWKKVAGAILKDCDNDPKRHKKLMSLCGKISGRDRTLLADSPHDMRSALQVSDEIFFESHYDAESLMHNLLKVLDAVEYDYSKVTIVVRNR